MGLSPRLQAIYNLVPNGKTFADIGTDHGYLTAALLSSGKCPKGIASDINPKPLEKAKRIIEHRGLAHCAQCRLGSGLEVLSPGEAQVLIMAGMGGYLIADLLEKGATVAHHAEILILQPMNNASVLRHYLQSHGYLIVGERVIKEGELFYQILTVVSGSMRSLKPIEAMIGYEPCQTRNEAFFTFIDFLIQKTQNTLHRVADKGTEHAQKREKECLILMDALLKVKTEVKHEC